MRQSAHYTYSWEMRFASGSIHIGSARGTPFDPNNIPVGYGRVEFIKLIPSKDNQHLSEVPLYIPEGAIGFHNRDVAINVGSDVLIGLRFRIGYRIDGTWIALSVSVADGSIKIEQGIVT